MFGNDKERIEQLERKLETLQSEHSSLVGVLESLGIIRAWNEFYSFTNRPRTFYPSFVDSNRALGEKVSLLSERLGVDFEWVYENEHIKLVEVNRVEEA